VPAAARKRLHEIEERRARRRQGHGRAEGDDGPSKSADRVGVASKKRLTDLLNADKIVQALEVISPKKGKPKRRTPEVVEKGDAPCGWEEDAMVTASRFESAAHKIHSALEAGKLKGTYLAAIIAVYEKLDAKVNGKASS
jgi:hypothetical protein